MGKQFLEIENLLRRNKGMDANQQKEIIAGLSGLLETTKQGLGDSIVASSKYVLDKVMDLREDLDAKLLELRKEHEALQQHVLENEIANERGSEDSEPWES